MSSKQYGLILKDKSKSLTFQSTRNVFGNDSDSEDESKNSKKNILLRPSDNVNRQAKITHEKAITEDPTVYQYDEIYDAMVSKKVEKQQKSKEEKKPKYIENLIKTANKRKIENERRIERQIQVEREKEGDEFKDKEIFVTSAYKKKLEELKLEEEREKREEYLESIGDVTKQCDLGGFYRHIYEQKLGKDSLSMDKEGNTKEDKLTSHKDAKTVSVETKKRNYRKRKASPEATNVLSDGEIADSEEEINRLNLDDIRIAKKSKNADENIDADSDFSIDESSDEETVKKVDKVEKADEDDTFRKPMVVEKESKNHPINKDKTPAEEVQHAPKPKPKTDIWVKRTVGEVFDQALKRYYERKAARGC